MTYPMQAPDQSAEMTSFGPTHSYRLARPGSRPLVFQGTELAMAMSFTPEIPYWYEINLYRTQEQSFAVAIRLFYQSETETDVVSSWDFPTLDAALNHIETYDAGADIRLPRLDMDKLVAAEMAAIALQTKAEIAAARRHFGGLVGELFAEIEAASVDIA